MPRFRTMRLAIALLGLLVLATAPCALAQGDFSVLGLSASPDAYVDAIEVEYGEDFELYVIITGPGAVEPLAHDFSSVGWAVLQACCGGSPAFMYDSQLSTEGLVHEGEPILGVTTSAPECVSADVIHVATLSFNWLYAPTEPFLLGAASMNAAQFCGEDPQFLSGCAVTVLPQGVTPAESSSWGGVKALYR